MKKTIKTILILAMILFLAPCHTTQAMEISATETAKISWRKSPVWVSKGGREYEAYLSKDKKYSWITHVSEINSNPKMDSTIIHFPKKIKGATVVKIGSKGEEADAHWNIMGVLSEPWHGWDGNDHGEAIMYQIEKVIMPSTVTTFSETVFSGFRNLKSITLPDNLEIIPNYTFYHCASLEQVVLPKNLKTIEINAFKKCNALKQITISDNSRKYICKHNLLLSKNKKTLIWAAPGKRRVIIPEGVKILAKNALQLSRARKVSIPASVNRIRDGALNGRKIHTITLSKDNKRYGKARNCIYSKKTERLVCAICRNGTVELPKEVKYMTANVSHAGTDIKELIIPKTFKKFKKGCFGYSGIHGLYNFSGGSFTVTFLSKTPPEAEKGSFNLFSTYFVPEGSLETYQNWYEAFGEDYYIEWKEY